jgi:serine/threonine protein kinase
MLVNKGGIFRLPTFLSTQAKELLSSMLVVDPLKRATISDIRKSPWFDKDLPEYLSHPQNPKAATQATFNEAVISKISQVL